MLSKPLLIAAGVLGLAVVGLSWGLWSALEANGGLESRNAQLTEDAQVRERELKQYAQLMEAQAKTLTEHREKIADLDEDLSDANAELDKLEAENAAVAALADCRLPSEFVDWLQPHGHDANKDTAGGDTRPSPKPAASPKANGQADSVDFGAVREKTSGRDSWLE